KWVNEHGKDVTYPVRDGYMECDRANGRIHTRDEFGDFQLHLEFATPAKVEGKGQGRGNNGINIYGRYEIQVLDSFDNPTYAYRQLGNYDKPHPPKGPIELYYHNNPVRFRNIWIRPIKLQEPD